MVVARVPAKGIPLHQEGFSIARDIQKRVFFQPNNISKTPNSILILDSKTD